MATPHSDIDAPLAQRRDFPVLAIALYGLWALLTVIGVTYVLHEAAEDIELETRREADSLANSLRDRLRDQEAVLNGFASFLAVVPGDDKPSVLRYAESVRNSYPQIYMLEVARRIERTARPTFERAMDRQGHPGFSIRSFAYDRGRTWSPVGDVAVTYPLVALYPPLPEADNVLGLDINSVPHLRAALVTAERSEKAVASGIFKLVEGDTAYVMLQRVARPPEAASAAIFAGRLHALLVIRTATLRPPVIDRRLTVTASIEGGSGESGPLFAQTAEAASALERRLLPQEQMLVTDIGNTPRVTLDIVRQMRWQDVRLSNVAVILLFSVASLGLLTTYLVAARQVVLADRRHRAEITRQALHDPLTGLANRILVIDRLNQALLAAHRRGQSCAVMLLNFDRFREINERYGHLAGEQVLREAGHRLDKSVREADSVGCLGGEEFVVILGDLVQVNHARAVAEKAQAALAKPYLIGSEAVTLRVHVGVSLFPDHGNDPDTLLRRADQAAREARQARWSGILFASPSPAPDLPRHDATPVN